tara:strand:- start:2889 stop:4415 length:1527 start_codon:yes stop_codon:yes gene_type:complete
LRFVLVKTKTVDLTQIIYESFSMSQFNRRQFLQSSLAAGAFVSLSSVSSSKAMAANEEVNIAVIGCGGRGGEHLNQFSSLSGVNVAGLVDPDESRTGSAQRKFPKAKRYTDIRKMLEDPSIDAVTIASCNHWHCLAAIWAMEAGKDVYVEKPLSHSQWEGRQVVNAARKYDKVVQIGTQQRSSPIQDEAKKLLHEEKALGKILSVQVCRYGIRGSIGKRSTPLEVPSSVDYDLWLGPAADQVLYRDKFHYDWHWDWNTGSGEMGNWGVHVLDDVRNVVFRDSVKLPTRILAGGGRVVWNDAGNTPNVHFAYFDTGEIPTFIGLSNLPAEPGSKKGLNYRGVTSGYLVQCEGGYYSGRRGGGDAYDNQGKKMRSLKGSSGTSHAQNFIDAVRAQDNSNLKAEVAVGHDSTGWCNLANIGFQVGGQYKPDAFEEIVTPNEGAKRIWSDLQAQMESHLAAHGYKLSDSEIRVSPMLSHDPETERFTGPHAEGANALLKRAYRPGFEVPEIA